MTKKRKAFTLTELLVVVVIIGVLAAVVLPKFTKMVEARKTTEAVEMMTAVRNEQEARCTLGKQYLRSFEKLGVYKDSDNYAYYPSTKTFEGVNKIVGMTATASNGKYTLKMPSYADGRICCYEEVAGGCADLGQSYPSCTELTAKSDYVAPNADCGVDRDSISEPEEQPGPEAIPCDKEDKFYTCQEKGYSANFVGKVTQRVNRETCTYEPEEDTCACGLREREIECPKLLGRMHGNILMEVDNENCTYNAKYNCSMDSCPKPKDPEPCPGDPEHMIYYTVNPITCKEIRDVSACKGCTNSPDGCPGGYWNKGCYCIKCEAGRGVKVNDSRTACEPIYSKQDCIEMGKVFWDLSKEEPNPIAGCLPCDDGMFYYPDFHFTGQSTDGTVYTCQKVIDDDTKCPLKYSQCGAQGKVLKAGADLQGNLIKNEACYCATCQELGYPDTYKSVKGMYCSDSSPQRCPVTEAECASRGGKARSWDCQSCISCSQHWPGEGTSSTGKLEDCSNCPTDD